ncbi:MAG TPA: right-handed parallel beta-helix repeat-containing protein, partial [Polyangiaceae bacterium]|nr:right-handed parallel beta-helix repeat-containing protein [Polyangiaceae bacterium]
NNHFSDGKTACLCSGKGSGGGGARGEHLIKNNTIQRCGEAGIAGADGLIFSVIEGNLIEEINPQKHFGGYESGGIKIHGAVDVTITGNIIRKVHAGASPSHPGIWIDWAGQGTRITGNVIYDIDQSGIEVEADHGPILIDNNIVIGGGDSWNASENLVSVHNLYVDHAWTFSSGDGRTPGYNVPHTSNSAGTATINSSDDRHLNNIYINKGTSAVPQQSGYQCDYNVLWGGGGKTSWGDTHSIANGFSAAFAYVSQADGVDISFNADTAPTDVAAPLITRDLIGINKLTMQGIENHDGSPITIDTDMIGATRDATHPTAGPFEELVTGANMYTFRAGAGVTSTASGGSTGAGGASGGSSATAGSSAMGGSGAGTVGAAGAAGSSARAGSAGASSGAGSSGLGKTDQVSGSSCGCRLAPSHLRSSLLLSLLSLAALVSRRRRTR